MFKVQTIYLF